MIKFQGIGAQGNYSQAGKAVADDTLRAFIAARRSSPNYGEIAVTAADIRKNEKLATLKNQAEVAAARLTADADVKASKMKIDGKSKLQSASRKAGALGLAGQLFGKIPDAGGEKPLEPYKGRYSREELQGDIDKFETEAKTIKDGIVVPEKPDFSTPGSSTQSSSGGGSGSTNSGATVAPGPGQLTKAQIKDYALGAGFSPGNASTVVGIAGGESGYDPSNSTKRSGLYAKTGEDSVGLMQINWGYHKDKGWLQNLGITSREQLLDPATNMKAAKYLYDGRGNFGDWTVYNEGIYKDYL